MIFSNMNSSIQYNDQFMNGQNINNTLTSDKTIRDIAYEWLLTKKNLIKKSSYNKYKNILESYILCEVGDCLLEKLNESQLVCLFQKLMVEGGRNGKGLSPRTLTEVLCIIRNILDYARNLGYYVPATGRRIVIRSKQPKIRTFNKVERTTLVHYLMNNYSRKNLGILICLFTGIRIGELCALQWDNISFPENILHVRHTIQRIQLDPPELSKTEVVLSSPKSMSSNRDIPLNDTFAGFLYKHKEKGYVLTGDPEKYLEPRVMQYHFHKVLKECNIESVNFHTLRHSFATSCIELGFDIKSLSEILGHTTVNITMNRYVHPSMEMKKQNMQRLTELFLL